MAQSTPYKFGSVTILAENEEDFANGYSNGFVGYPEQNQQPLTEQDVRRLIIQNLTDPTESLTWNTGYVLGALAGLYVGPYRGDEPHAPQVQLGPVAFYLNRWRFRDGYFMGQEKYQTRQAEHPTPNVIFARELLDLIAHRDSITQTYHFSANELTGLEDILGQLVGYLCAALFSETKEGPTTEPLAVAASQEA